MLRAGEEPAVAGQQERGMLPGEAAAGASGAGGAGGAGGVAVREAEPLEVSLWLERIGPGVEQQATAPAAPPPEEGALPAGEPAAPPPIAQPIQPKGRCGCSAAEGISGFGLLLSSGLALRRGRRQHGRAHPRAQG
jgi:hypothetical protein